jgi:hypothetical protein
MRSMSMLQLLGGVAVAGAVAAGSTAFTAAGLTSNAGSTSFIGGQVTQTINGATLTSVAYHFTDAPANTHLDSITLVMADANSDGKTVAVVPHGGTWSNVLGAFTCTNPTVVNSHTSVCTDASNYTYDSGLTTVDISVS